MLNTVCLGIMDASRKDLHLSTLGAHCIRILDSLLWADATCGALQVFLPQQFLAVENPGAILSSREEGLEEGVWIAVDPVPGCLVVNVGESL
jgi:isopenicillin N synthase-like dioxygenase